MQARREQSASSLRHKTREKSWLDDAQDFVCYIHDQLFFARVQLERSLSTNVCRQVNVQKHLCYFAALFKESSRQPWIKSRAYLEFSIRLQMVQPSDLHPGYTECTQLYECADESIQATRASSHRKCPSSTCTSSIIIRVAASLFPVRYIPLAALLCAALSGEEGTEVGCGAECLARISE